VILFYPVSVVHHFLTYLKSSCCMLGFPLLDGVDLQSLTVHSPFLRFDLKISRMYYWTKGTHHIYHISTTGVALGQCGAGFCPRPRFYYSIMSLSQFSLLHVAVFTRVLYRTCHACVRTLFWTEMLRWIGDLGVPRWKSNLFDVSMRSSFIISIM
jgi:hypothetical protein